jgi:hypothetical protein
MPVKGLAIEADAAGYYNDGSTVNSFFLQTAVGPVLDFNPYITPDSDFFHPYVRAGLLYAFLFSQDDTVLSDQNGPGFFTGAGLNFNFPIVSIGVETNYNYVDLTQVPTITGTTSSPVEFTSKYSTSVALIRIFLMDSVFSHSRLTHVALYAPSPRTLRP